MVALAGGHVDRGEDRLRAADPERLGQEGRGRQRQARGRPTEMAEKHEGAGTREPRAAPGERDPAQGVAYFAMAELDRRSK
jgi:hypothetical protein